MSGTRSTSSAAAASSGSSSSGIREIEPGDYDRLGALFERYPFKQTQRSVQGLDAARLNDFYLDQLRASAGPARARWGVFKNGEAVALGGLADDAWHSSFYGLKMAKLQPWMNAPAAEGASFLLDHVIEHAAKAGVEHLSVRIDGEDFPNLYLFESRGFRLVDVSLKFSRLMPLIEEGRGVQGAPTADPASGGFSLSTAEASDRDWMRELGGRAHGHNHFLNDPDLARDRTEKLFAAWVERCIDGLAWRIYTARDAEGVGRGFVIYLRNTRFAEAVGRNPIILDYVILDPSVRGAGLGPWLIRESLRREAGAGFDFCELRTSHHNLAAIRCYEKLGFRVCATDFVLHRRLA